MIKMHPFSSIIFNLILFFTVIVYDNPLYLLSIFIFLSLFLFLLDSNKSLKNILKFGIYTSIFIIIINPIVSGAGRTVIYKSPKLLLIGRILISLEGIAYGINMSLKLLCIMLVFACYSAMTDKDDTFTFFSKYAYKLTLTISMTVNILHRLKVEIERVKYVMAQRGVRFEEKGIIKRIKAYYPVLKVILISTLEGSISRAEALYSRGYGNTKRTYYKNIEIDRSDILYIGVTLVLALLFILGISLEFNSYSFYPYIERPDAKEVLFLLPLDGYLIVYLIYIMRLKKWKYLI